MDELIDMSVIKAKTKFDNPFVLSFLANTCFPGSFVPEGYYTPFEFSRLRFISTGQLGDMTVEMQQLIVGGMIVCRALCRELLFHCSKYFKDIKPSPNGFANLDILGSIIYHSFINQVEKLEALPDNTAQVTQNEEPTCLEKGIPWKETAEGEDGDGILLGVPEASTYKYDTNLVEGKMDKFLDNMTRFVKMQGEDERLPLHKKKLEVMQAVSAKAKRADSDLYQYLADSIKQKERELKVPS